VVGSPARAAELFAAQSRTTDLVVIGQADTEIGNTFQDEVIEAVLFGSGRPLLIVPYVGVRQVLPKHVLIGWDGRAQASRAMHDALPLLKEAEQVSLIVVEEVGKKRPATETPVENAAAQLARHGIKAEISHLPSGDLDVGNAILSRAADLGVDLLVMGGYGHSRMRELVLGGATRGILQTMTVPVFMSH
jgi:nucleotide-binding universal stress UspA family protein